MGWTIAETEVLVMDISFGHSLVPYTDFESRSSQSKTNRDRVEDAATVTGATGAGAAATRGSALKFFKTSAGKVNTITGAAADITNAVEAPARQSKSLLNAFRINYRNFTNQIANWAEASKMPNFMKAMFTGKLGAFIGKGAAVFVFTTGIAEVFSTLMKNANKLGVKMSTVTSDPYGEYDKFEYMDPREYMYRRMYEQMYRQQAQNQYRRY